MHLLGEITFFRPLLGNEGFALPADKLVAAFQYRNVGQINTITPAIQGSTLFYA